MLIAQKNKYINKGIAVFILLFSFFICLLNYYMPLLPGDDYLYHLCFPGEGHIGDKPISNFIEYFDSQKNHYLNYNYRIAPHAILQLVFLLPNIVFDLLNTLVFMVLPLLILRPFREKVGDNYIISYFIVLLFLWCFHFDLGRAYFWTSGSLNYTWMLVPQLIFLNYLIGKHRDRKTSEPYWLILMSVNATALSNENVCFGLFLFSAAIYFKRNRIKLNDKGFLLTICILLIGGLIMLFAPSLTGRLSYQGFAFESFEFRFMEYFRRVVYYGFRYSLVFIILILFIGKKKLNQTSKMLFSLILLTILVMFFAPLFEPRSAIFGFILSIMMALSSIEHFERINNVGLVALVGLSVYLLFSRIPDFQALAVRAEKNLTTLETRRGSNDIVFLDKYCSSSKSECLVCDEISDDPRYIDNEPLAAYYGINEIRLKPAYSHVLWYDDFAQDSFSFEGFRTLNVVTPLKDDILLRNIYVKDSSSQLRIVYEFEGKQLPEDYIFILRGMPESGVKKFFIKFLPLNIQLYFLDYLEHQAPFKEKGMFTYGYNHVFNPNEYEYYVSSLYSVNNHAPVGKSFILDVD